MFKGALLKANAVGRSGSRLRVQLARFCLVGVCNVAVHFATFAVSVAALGHSQLLSNAFAYLVASSWSFVMNSIWTFEVKLHLRRYARFQMVGVAGLTVAAILGRLGDKLHWRYAVTVFATVLILPLVTFLAHRAYTFAGGANLSPSADDSRRDS